MGAFQAQQLETIFKDVSELGFAGLELFDWQIAGLESQGVLGQFVEKYKLPLVSSYTSVQLTDPARRAYREINDFEEQLVDQQIGRLVHPVAEARRRKRRHARTGPADCRPRASPSPSATNGR